MQAVCLKDPDPGAFEAALVRNRKECVTSLDLGESESCPVVLCPDAIASQGDELQLLSWRFFGPIARPTNKSRD